MPPQKRKSILRRRDGGSVTAVIIRSYGALRHIHTKCKHRNTITSVFLPDSLFATLNVNCTILNRLFSTRCSQDVDYVFERNPHEKKLYPLLKKVVKKLKVTDSISCNVFRLTILIFFLQKIICFLQRAMVQLLNLLLMLTVRNTLVVSE